MKVFLKAQHDKRKKRRNFYGERQPSKVNNTYIAQLLDSYSKKRLLKPAMQIFRALRAKGGRPSVENYRKFLYAVGYKGRDVQSAEQIFEDLMLWKEDKTNAREDIYCFNTMMHTYAKNVGGMEGYNKARKLFDQMVASENRRLKPNSFSYFYLLKCFCPRTYNPVERTNANGVNAEGEELGEEEVADEELVLPELTPYTVELEGEQRSTVEQVIEEMIRSNTVLLANRHIKDLLQRMNMQEHANSVAIKLLQL